MKVLREIQGIKISSQAEEIWAESVIVDASLQEPFDEQGLQNYQVSGVTAMFSTLGVMGPRGSMWSSENALWALAQYCEAFHRFPNRVAVGLTAGDIRQAKMDKKCAVVMGFQNAVALGFYSLSEYKDPQSRRIDSLRQFYQSS